MLRWTLAIALLTFVKASKKSYEGYVVLKASNLTLSQQSLLANLTNGGIFELWSSGPQAEVMSGPDNVTDLKDLFESNGIEFETSVSNLQK